MKKVIIDGVEYRAVTPDVKEEKRREFWIDTNDTNRFSCWDIYGMPQNIKGEFLVREVTETGEMTDSKNFDCPECLQKFAGSFEEFWNNRNSVKVPWNDLTEAQKALRAFIHGTTRGIAIMKDKAIEEIRK